VIENPRTGEQIEFDTADPAVLVMYSTWTRPGNRAVEHVHPAMEERFEVLEGRASFLIDGRPREADPGDVVVVPPGVRHLAWNPTQAPVRLRLEMRPPLRWEQFTRRLFAGEDPGRLLAEYGAEIVLP
jgi:quercetin dioxygenase-like cupin family protein